MRALLTLAFLFGACDAATGGAPDLSTCAAQSCTSGLRWNDVQCKCTTPMGQLGDPCGGNVASPPPACMPPLMCKGTGPVGDVGGTCR